MLNDIQSQSAFYEFSEIDKLRQHARKNNKEALTTVARQFESLFTRMMLKSMRDASLGDPLFESQTTNFYRDMADDQLAVNLATQGSMGLADMLVRQMEKHLPKDGTDLGLQETTRRFPIGQADYVNKISRGLKDENGEVKVNPTQYVSPELKIRGPEKDSFPIQAPAPKLNMPIKSSFSGDPGEFIEQLLPLAEKYAKELGVSPKVLLAQAALETGWGKHVIRTEQNYSHNLFNIKADQRWSGGSMLKSSLEFSHGSFQPEKSQFRVYESFEQSFADYVDFIKQQPRYEKAMQVRHDEKQYLRELQEAGYATDPDYAKKVERILNDQPLQTVATTSKKAV